MPTVTWASDRYTVGGSFLFDTIFKADGTVINITGGTVSLYFRKPNGTILTRSGTITDGAAGVAEYETDGDDFTVDGNWARRWTVTVGGIVYVWTWYEFYVHPAA